MVQGLHQKAKCPVAGGCGGGDSVLSSGGEHVVLQEVSRGPVLPVERGTAERTGTLRERTQQEVSFEQTAATLTFSKRFVVLQSLRNDQC